MVRQGVDPLVAQQLGHLFHPPARLAVDDAAVVPGGVGMLVGNEAQQLLQRVFFLDDGVADVGPVKAADEQACILQLQPLDDVFAREGIGRGRERNARHLRVALVQQRERPVLGAEVMAPLAHAMRFVDGKQRQVAAVVQAVEQAQKARRVQPLGRGIQQRDLAGLQPPFHVLRGVKVERGVEKRRIHPRFVQRTHLIVHQRDQRRHHDGPALALPLPYDGRHLVAQALAATCGHEHQGVATANHMFDDGLLRAAELLVAEDVLQHGMGRGQRGGQTRGQANTLKLIAASA